MTSKDRVAVRAPFIPGRQRVHCSYHKNLTLYFERVFTRLCESALGRSRLGRRYRYRHFRSELQPFYEECASYDFASINNRAVDLDRFEDIRVTRFVRDPRDLLVSGYHYHKSASEPWCNLIDPSEADWQVVRGAIPSGLGRGRSYAQYLNEVSLEEGLLAELEFRTHHFESMRQWPENDPRVRVFRYEEILGNEAEVFGEIFELFELPFWARWTAMRSVRKLSAARRRQSSSHIRDPRAGQWRDGLPPALVRRMHDEYGDVIERLGYALE